jgi:hypothetical protein
VAFRVFLLGVALGACACSAAPGATPDTAAKPASAQNPWSACYADFTPIGSAHGDLARLTHACGSLGGLHAVTPVVAKVQSAKAPADRYTFYVPGPGACYRVFAAGDYNVHDLDLLIHDAAGQTIAADLSHDSFPVVPPSGPLCFDRGGLYMLEVSVFRGAGHYAVQVWGNTPEAAKPGEAGATARK